MKRRRYIGAANKGGIEFTDLSTSNLNAQQAGMVYGHSPIGTVSTGVSYSIGNDFSNINLYGVLTQKQLTNSEVSSPYEVYLVIHFNTQKYLINLNSNNQLEYIPVSDLASFSSQLSAQWIMSGSSTAFNLKNKKSQTLFLRVDNSGVLSVVSNDTAIYFCRSSSVLKGVTGSSSNWYGYYNNSYFVTTAEEYSSFLYTYTVSTISAFGLSVNTYTLTRKESLSSISSSDNLMLVVRNPSGLYYLVGINGTSVSSTYINASSSNNGGTLSFRDFNAASYMTRFLYSAIVSNDTLYLKSKSNSTYYLAKPNTIGEGEQFTFSTTQSAFKYNSANGLYVQKNSYSSYAFGVNAITNQYDATTNVSTSGTTIVFRYNGSAWSPYYGSLYAGDTYAIAVRQAPADPDNPGAVTADYYLVGYDGTEMTHHNFSTFADITITSDCEFAATQGTYGVGLTSNNKGLNVNNEHLAMLDVSADWVYIGDSTTPENSRLWSVVNQTVTYYPEYANSDLEANTSATETTAECYLVQNGKIQTIVDELVNGETYVIVFVDSGNHYAACVSGTDIVPVLFRDKLPQRLPVAYRFVAQASGDGFYLLNGQNKLGVAVNTKLSVGEYSAVWHYTVPEEPDT